MAESSSVSDSHVQSDCKICKIPPELLKEIFEHLCADDATKGNTSNDISEHEPFMHKSTIGTAVKLSHVCSVWREITIGTPGLWATVDRFDDLAKNFLTRSKGLPIVVHLVPQPDRNPESSIIKFPSWLEEQSSRVREISAEGPAKTLWTLLQSLERSLPQLLSLDLRMLDSEPLKLQTATPNLRRLCLYRISADLGAYSHLTNLTLEGFHPGFPIPKAAEFLNLLRRSPTLEVLRLCNLGLDLAEDGVEVGTLQVVELPYLSILEYRHLIMDTTIHLLSYIKMDSYIPYPARDRLAPLSPPSSLEIVIADRHLTINLTIHSMGASRILRIELPCHPLTSCGVILDIRLILSTMDLSTTTSLSFSVSHLPDVLPTAKHWKDILAFVPSLSTIAISLPRLWIETFMDALCLTDSELPCGQLRDLTVINIFDRFDSEWSSKLFAKVIRDHLLARVDSGGNCLHLLQFYGRHERQFEWKVVTGRYKSLTSSPDILN